MPTTCGHKDSKGYYCQWGGHGAHYYYTPGNEESLNRAKAKANTQGAAAHAHGYQGAMDTTYYSTAKPYYRFQIDSLKKELESIGWNKIKLIVDIKADGLRLSVGKIGGKPFCYVDPESLKKKSPDVSGRLPQIMKELESIPDNTVLDGEFIAVKGDECLHRTTANGLLNAVDFPSERLAEYANLFIFDVLFFDGEDIRTHPLHERVEYLQRIKPTPHIWIEKQTTNSSESADAYIVDGSNWDSVLSAINNIFNDKTGRPRFMAEGVMLKDINHQYEYPHNKGWGKCKKFYEVDCRVWDSKFVSGQDDVYNYFLGIDIPNQEYYDHLPNDIKVPGLLAMNYGKSNATKIVCEKNEILRVASEEVLKTENDGFPYYRGYVSVPMEKIGEKDVSDTLDVLDKLSSFQPKRIPIAEINRLEDKSVMDLPTQQEQVVSPPSGNKVPNEKEPGSEETPGEEEDIQLKHSLDGILEKSYKYPMSIVSLLHLADSINAEILEWINSNQIPTKIYKELAQPGKPLNKIFYIDQRVGDAFLQMHFRGITPEEYKSFQDGTKELWQILVGHSLHMDLRIAYEGLDRLVQYVITENDVQSMVNTLLGVRTQNIAGMMNVHHSKVVSKPSGEPQGENRFYKAEPPEDELGGEKPASINAEGAKLAASLDLGNPKEETLSYFIEPGGIGATETTWSYMMLIWQGSVITGCERHDLHELFFTKKNAKQDLLSGKFTIKCLEDASKTKRWEIWKSIRDPKPMDPIMHSDMSYHWLVPEEKVEGLGREYYRSTSVNLFKKKLG